MKKMVRVTAPLGVFFDKDSIPARTLEAASDRGRAVHAACAAYAKRLPVILENGSYPYFGSFREWFDKYVKRVLFVEQEFRDDTTYHILGHPDLVAELIDGRVVVVDYKTPQAESRTWAAQVATYCYLVSNRIGGVVHGMALILSDSGGAARAIPYQYKATDFAAFCAALTAYRYFKA